MKKRLVLIALLLAAALVLVGCAQKAPEPTAVPATEAPAATETPATDAPAAEAPAVTEAPTAPQDATQSIELTLEELARFNGKDGQRAYIAVEGVIYDVTDHASWKDGVHKGFEAGKDGTEAIRAVSHGVGVLKDLPVVGKLITK